MTQAKSVRSLGPALCAILACAAVGWLAAPAGFAGAQDAASAAGKKAHTFRPAEVVSAVNTQYPVQTNIGDIAVLDVSLDAEGNVEGTHPLRDVAPLTASAAASLRRWKFRRARADGSPVPSTLTAVFVFRPPVSVWQPPPFRPVLHVARSAGYVPPGILAAVWAKYPVRSVESGSVVVQVAVDRAGYVAGARALRGIAGFTQLALDAAQQWRFRPATLDGRPVPARVAIVFVFANPVLNPFPSFSR